jgi:hypothetical protein
MNKMWFFELLQFVWDHRTEMCCTLAAPTIVTISFEDDPQGKKILRVCEALANVFGAYMTDPTSLNVLGQPNCMSFGFRTLSDLEMACQFFPALLAALQAGPPVYIGPQP